MEYRISGYGNEIFRINDRYYLKLKNVKTKEILKETEDYTKRPPFIDNSVTIQISLQDYRKFTEEIEEEGQIHLEGKIKLKKDSF